jgi:ribonuclease P protein component
VDDTPGTWQLGCVVPKRHARRSVTRNMIKRQMRAAALRLVPALGDGLWLLRQRAPFPVAHYPSADSVALRLAVRHELDELLSRCAGHAAPARNQRSRPAGRRARAAQSALLPPDA